MSSYRRWSSGRSHALVRPQYGAAQRHRDHERGYTCRAFRLQPHRVETFKLSTDLLFVDKACPGSDPGCATSSGFTATRPTLPWCRASMKSADPGIIREALPAPTRILHVRHGFSLSA